MPIVETLQLMLVIGMCCITSITDIRGGRIANKHLAVVAMLATILNAIYYGLFVKELLSVFLLNLIIIVAVSILLYAYKIWAAGDTKLLIILVYLLPARIYYPDSASVSPAVWLIIITFSVAFVYLFGESVVLGIKHGNLFKVDFLKINLVAFIKQYFLCFIYLCLFSEILMLPLFAEFAANNAPLITLASMLILLSVLNIKLFKNVYLIIATIIGVVTIGIFERFSVFGAFDSRVLIIALIVVALRLLAEKHNYKLIPTEQLKEGMILSWASIALFTPSRIQGLPKATTEDMDSRLSAQQVADIHRWKDSKYGSQELSIVRKLPFAIFISIGFAVYSIVRVTSYGH